MRPKNDARKMEVYNFMTRYMEEQGVYPTTREIGDRLGMANSIVSKYRNRLIEEGLIEKLGRYRMKTAANVACSKMPVIGHIACGEPILAIENIEGYLPIDEGSLGPGDYFGLIADGDSMINAGICEGDIVYVRKQNVPNHEGDIVVAMIADELTDGYRATLKRFYRDEKNNLYILHPENDAFDDIILSEVQVIGVAVRVLKNLESSNRRRC